MTQKFIDIVARCRAQGLEAVTREIQGGLRGIRADISVAVPASSQRNIESLNRSLGSVNGSLAQISANSNTMASSLNRATPASRAVATGLSSIVSSGSAATATMRQFTTATRQSEDGMNAFGFQTGLALRRFSAFTLSAGSFIRLVQLFKEGTSSGIQFQREMVRISQVSGETGDKISGLAKQVTSLATSLGVSSADLTQSAVVLKQAGLNIKDTEIALGALAKAALAPNFDSLTQTSEGMIAIMAQFKQGAGALESQLGSINAVAGEFAVEASDLITVVQKAGGTFKAAGGELNELLAIFTSVRATTRESADQIATGLRTIFGRLQRSDVVESLKDLQINLRYTREEAERMGDLKLTNQFVGVFESFQRLSDGLNKLPDGSPQFAAIVEQIGGLRQLSRTIPAIREFASAQKALQVAQAGSISLDIAKEKSQEALAFRIQATKEKFLELFRAITDDSGFKTLLDGTLAITNNFLAMAKAVTPVIPLLTAFATVTAIKAVTSGPVSNFARGLTHGGYGGARPPGFAHGDVVPGVGSGDKIPALLEPGEFIFSKQAVENIGIDRLRQAHQRGRSGNADSGPRRYAMGGYVERFAEGGEVERHPFKNFRDIPGIRESATVLATAKGIDPKQITDIGVEFTEAGPRVIDVFNDIIQVAKQAVEVQRQELKQSRAAKAGPVDLEDEELRSRLKSAARGVTKKKRRAGLLNTEDDDEQDAYLFALEQGTKNYDPSKGSLATYIGTSAYNAGVKKSVEAEPTRIKTASLDKEYGSGSKSFTGADIVPGADVGAIRQAELKEQAAEQQRVLDANVARFKQGDTAPLTNLIRRGRPKATPQSVGQFLVTPYLQDAEAEARVNAEIEQSKVARSTPTPSLLASQQLSTVTGGGGVVPPLVVTAAAGGDDEGSRRGTRGSRRNQLRSKSLAYGPFPDIERPNLDFQAAKREHQERRENASRHQPVNVAATVPDSGLISTSLLGPIEAGPREEERQRREAQRARKAAIQDGASYRKPHPSRSNAGTFPLNADNYQLREHTPNVFDSIYESEADAAEQLRKDDVRQQRQQGRRPNTIPRSIFVKPYQLQHGGLDAPIPAGRSNLDISGNLVTSSRNNAAAATVPYGLQADGPKLPRASIGADTLLYRRLNESIGAESVTATGSNRRPHDLLSQETKDRIAERATREQYNRTHRDLTLAEERLLKVTLPEISSKEAYKLATERATAALTTGAKLSLDARGGILGTSTSVAAATFATNGAYQPTSQATTGQSLLSFFGGRGSAGAGTPGESRFSKFVNSGAASRLATPALFAAPIIAQQVAGLAGTAETAAASQTGTVGFRGARGASGAVTGALTAGFVGASVGSLYGASGGPIGAAVGVVVGGLAGFLSALKEAESDIRQVKINTSLTEFTDRLAALNQTGSGLAGNVVGASKNSLKETRDLLASQDKQSSRGLFGFGSVDFETFSTLQRKSTRQSFGQQLPQLTGFLSQQADRLGRTDMAGKVEDLSASLLNGNDGLNREFVSIIASIRGLSISQVMEEFGKTIKSAQTSAKTQAEQRSGRQSQADSVGSFGRLVLSVQSAADGLQRLQAQTTLLSDLFHGVVGSSHVSAGTERLGQFGRNDQGALDTLGVIRSVGGDEGQHLYRSGQAVDQVANVLPGLLSSAISKGGEGENSIETISRSLPKALGYESIVKAPQEIQAVLNTVLDGLRQADSSGPGALKDAVRFDATKFTEKILEPLAGPLKESGEKIGRLLQENANKFSDGLTHFRGLLDNTRQLQFQRDTQGTSRLRIANQFEADNRGAGHRAIDFLSLRDLEAPNRNRQARLVGGTEAQNSDPEYIGQQLSRVQKEIVAADEKQQKLFLSREPGQGAGSKSFADAAVQLGALKDRAANLQEALKHLGDTTSITAAAQEKLSRLQEEKQARLGIGENYLNSDPEGRSRMNRGYALINQFADFQKRTGQKGTLQGLSPDDQRLAVQTARGAGPATLRGGYSGNQLADQMVQNTFGFANLNTDQAKQQVDLQQEIKTAFVRAETATETLIANQQSLSTTFFATLAASHEGFFSRLAAELTRDKSQADKNESARLGVQQGELSKTVDQKKLLGTFGVDTPERLEDFAKQKGNLESLISTQTELDNSRNRQRGGIASAGKVSFDQYDGVGFYRNSFGLKSLGSRSTADQRQNIASQLTKSGVIKEDEATKIVSRFEENSSRDYFKKDSPSKSAQLQAATQEILSEKDDEIRKKRGDALVDIRGAGFDREAGVLSSSSVKELEQLQGALTALSSTEMKSRFSNLGSELDVLNRKLQSLNSTIPGGTLPLGPPGAASAGPPGLFAQGDVVHGVGNKDSVDAKLMPGEFIFTKQRVREIGLDKLRRLHNGQTDLDVPGYAKGGLVKKPRYSLLRGYESEPDHDSSELPIFETTESIRGENPRRGLTPENATAEQRARYGVSADGKSFLNQRQSQKFYLGGDFEPLTKSQQQERQVTGGNSLSGFIGRNTGGLGLHISADEQAEFGHIAKSSNGRTINSPEQEAKLAALRPRKTDEQKEQETRDAFKYHQDQRKQREAREQAPLLAAKRLGNRQFEQSQRDADIIGEGDPYGDTIRGAQSDLAGYQARQTGQSQAGVVARNRDIDSTNRQAGATALSQTEGLDTRRAAINAAFPAQSEQPVRPSVSRVRRPGESDVDKQVRLRQFAAENEQRRSQKSDIAAVPTPSPETRREATLAQVAENKRLLEQRRIERQNQARTSPASEENSLTSKIPSFGRGGPNEFGGNVESASSTTDLDHLKYTRSQRREVVLASGQGTSIAARRQRALQSDDPRINKQAILGAQAREGNDPRARAAGQRDRVAQGNFNRQSAIYHAEDPGAAFGRGVPDFDGQKNIGINALQRTAQDNTRAAQQNPLIQQYQQQQFGTKYGVGPGGQSTAPQSGQFSIPPQQPAGNGGQTQGAVNGQQRGLDPNVMASLTNGFASFGTSSTGLVAAFGKFETSSKTLSEALNSLVSMPKQFDLNGTQEVIVHMNGAEALATLEPAIKEWIAAGATAAVEKAFKNKIPDA